MQVQIGSSRCLIGCSNSSQSCPNATDPNSSHWLSTAVTLSAAQVQAQEQAQEQVQVQVPSPNIIPSHPSPSHSGRQDGTCQKGGVGRASKDSCGGRCRCLDLASPIRWPSIAEFFHIPSAIYREQGSLLVFICQKPVSLLPDKGTTARVLLNHTEKPGQCYPNV